ncbi:MAG: T9SS type A sorting domain-containing protein, partial [Balneolaceae bacterium]
LYFDNAVMEKIDATSNETPDEIPAKFALNQNYPNPFNPTTKISYDLPEASDVMIKIYDITGREVAELINTRQSAGTHNIEWNAKQFATGVYLYRITAGDFTAVRKLTLIK